MCPIAAGATSGALFANKAVVPNTTSAAAENSKPPISPGPVIGRVGGGVSVVLVVGGAVVLVVGGAVVLVVGGAVLEVVAGTVVVVLSVVVVVGAAVVVVVGAVVVVVVVVGASMHST